MCINRFVFIALEHFVMPSFQLKKKLPQYIKVPEKILRDRWSEAATAV